MRLSTSGSHRPSLELYLALGIGKGRKRTQSVYRMRKKKERRMKFTLRSCRILDSDDGAQTPSLQHNYTAQNEMKIKNLYFISRTLPIIRTFINFMLTMFPPGTAMRYHRAETVRNRHTLYLLLMYIEQCVVFMRPTPRNLHNLLASVRADAEGVSSSFSFSHQL